MPTSFSLEIAGLGFLGVCDSAKIADALTTRYRDFPSGGDYNLEVEIQITGQERESAILDTGMVFEDGILNFSAPGFQGFIRENEGVGKLSLSSRQPLEDIEYFIRVAYALLAFQAGGILLHTAGIQRKGLAYLFFGHSGSGKTTVSRLSEKDTVLNDDLVILMPDKGDWQVYGTPFWNPSQVKPAPQHAPLAGLYRLAQDKRVYLEDISQSETLAELIANVPVIPADPTRTPKLISRLQQITQAIQVKRLHFLPDPSFWDLITPRKP
jgi:hypothetical protein